jgi:quercetin dioxygenase-like cupin family protein
MKTTELAKIAMVVLTLVSAMAVLLHLAATRAGAQDAAQADKTHMKVEVETDQVRVLRYHYGPHESAAMHSHPNAVDIVPTDGHMRLTTPDGQSVEHRVKVGDVHANKATRHTVENLGDKPFEGILVELKDHAPTAKAK